MDLDNTKVIPLKVRIYYKKEYSDIYQKTYILDTDIENRFDLSIISITSDSYNLYDYNYGILVGGVTLDNYRTLFPTILHGNYNQRDDEWLRDCHINMFTQDGVSIIDDNMQMICSGAGSVQTYKTKSLKIQTYSGNKINLTYDEELSNLSIINEYNSLRLRFGGQDLVKTNIRSSVVSRLAQESNFDGCSNTERAVVFLNGEFYGICDIQQNYSNSFLADRYGIEDKENIVKEKIGKNLDYILEKHDVLKYMKLDLNDGNNRKELEEHVDMDNYLLYIAIEILTNNEDWYVNNNEMWYYDKTKGKEDSKYADGRVRFLLYDMDMIYYNRGINRFKECLDTDTSFRNIMSSKYYRDKFITLVGDLINTSFKDENIIKIIDEEYEKIKTESTLEYENKYIIDLISEEYNKIILQDEIETEWETKDYNETIFNNILKLKETAVSSDDEVIEELEKRYNLKEKYNFSITCQQGIKAYWNNMEIYENESYLNEYYKDVGLMINFEEYPGYKFDYWLVNGETIYTKVLEINDEIIKNDEINILLCTKRDDSVKLILSEINSKGDNDWIKLSNISEYDINIQDYYISDNISNLKLYRLPNIKLKSNDSIIINGKKNHYSIGNYICNFNLSKGETLYLYNISEKSIVDEIQIPKMSKIETYGRYLNSNTMMYFNKSVVK